MNVHLQHGVVTIEIMHFYISSPLLKSPSAFSAILSRNFSGFSKANLQLVFERATKKLLTVYYSDYTQ